jgi:DNA adenine methylase Dam
MIVSAIPFTGNKRKLWSQIEPLLPEGKVFVDMFMGGGTMALNATTKYERVIGCEILEPLMNLHKAYKNDSNFIQTVKKLSKFYPTTKEGYLQLRQAYNIEPSAAKLQTLILRSNSNMMRFNSKGCFNMTYGERNSYNLERMEIHSTTASKIELLQGSYEELFSTEKFLFADNTVKDFVFYSDSPYSTTTATYCENGSWSEEDDNTLLGDLLQIQKIGGTVVASNVFENKGVINKRWIDFCNEHEDKFTVHHLNRSYNNSSFRKSSGNTDEVLIVSK